MRLAAALVVLSLSVGCADRINVENSTEGYAARGFKDLDGPRSDANLDPPLGTVDFDDQLDDHMSRQKGGTEYEEKERDRR